MREKSSNISTQIVEFKRFFSNLKLRNLKTFAARKMFNKIIHFSHKRLTCKSCQSIYVQKSRDRIWKTPRGNKIPLALLVVK